MRITHSEVHPLEIRRNSLRSTKHVGVKGSSFLSLATDKLVEGSQSLLHDLDDMIFEGCEVILNRNQVVLIIILFKHLLVKSVEDLPLKDVRIIRCIHLSKTGFETGSMLT